MKISFFGNDQWALGWDNGHWDGYGIGHWDWDGNWDNGWDGWEWAMEGNGMGVSMGGKYSYDIVIVKNGLIVLKQEFIYYLLPLNIVLLFYSIYMVPTQIF